MTEDKSIKDSNSLGLLPLYPFPSLNSSSGRMIAANQSHLPLGSFLPPVFSYFDVSFIEEMAPIEGNRILSELITEEVRCI